MQRLTAVLSPQAMSGSGNLVSGSGNAAPAAVVSLQAVSGSGNVMSGSGNAATDSCRVPASDVRFR